MSEISTSRAPADGDDQSGGFSGSLRSTQVPITAVLNRIHRRVTGSCLDDENLDLLRLWASIVLRTLAALSSDPNSAPVDPSGVPVAEVYRRSAIGRIVGAGLEPLAAQGSAVVWLRASLRWLDQGVVAGDERARYAHWTAVGIETLEAVWQATEPSSVPEEHAVQTVARAVRRHVALAAAALNSTFAVPTQGWA